MNADPTLPPAPPAEPPRSRRGPPLVPILLVVLLGGAGLFVFLRAPEQPVAAPAEPRAEPVEAPRVPDAKPEVRLSGTDPRVRELLSGLSQDAELLRWLSADDLVRRFVSATHAVAEGQSPRVQLSFLAPGSSFQVTRRAGRTVMAPASQARFDGIARALASVDTRGVQRVYQELGPLLEAAHAELSPPGRSFGQVLSQAIGRLTSVPVPTGAIELTPKGALYVYADPQLEALGGAEKHLLRMGPENMRKVQTKLSEIAVALGLPSPQQARQP